MSQPQPGFCQVSSMEPSEASDWVFLHSGILQIKKLKDLAGQIFIQTQVSSSPACDLIPQVLQALPFLFLGFPPGLV